MSWEIINAFVIVVFTIGLFVINCANMSKAENDERLRALQIRYLVVYSLAVAADWLQGPYMYALYESYNLSVHAINLLFVGGFGSSLLAGTFVGSFADKYGRKFNVMLYVTFYVVSCITKHSSSFGILFIGRITGGIATSILFSAFESWYINEHKSQGLSPDLLATTFSYATLLNSIMAIISGFIAQMAVSATGLYVSSFDASIVILIVTGILTTYLWKENYGDVNKPLNETLRDSWNVITSSVDRRPLILGIAIALFEAAMYMFVLEWTPALKIAFYSDVSTKEKSLPFLGSGVDDSSTTAVVIRENHSDDIPYGLVFAAFMVACMAGSVIFKYMTNLKIPVEQFLTGTVITSALCLLCPLVPGVSRNIYVLLMAFTVFEICVGVFWPGTAMLRSLYLSEESRCTIMNFYRVPLNCAVVMVLCFDLDHSHIFTLVVCCLAISAFCFGSLEIIRKRTNTFRDASSESTV